MNPKKPFSKDIILLDNIETVVENIVQKMREDVLDRFKRKGAVVGISGGVDSCCMPCPCGKSFWSRKGNRAHSPGKGLQS